jgi:hypothetical protein
MSGLGVELWMLQGGGDAGHPLDWDAIKIQETKLKMAQRVVAETVREFLSGCATKAELEKASSYEKEQSDMFRKLVAP